MRGVGRHGYGSKHASGPPRRVRSAAVTLTDEIREAAAWVAGRAQHVQIDEDAIDAYARGLPSVSPPAPDLRRAPTTSARRVLPAAQRDQLRLGLVPDAEQAARALGLPHGREGAARPRPVDGAELRRSRARDRRRRSGRTPSTR